MLWEFKSPECQAVAHSRHTSSCAVLTNWKGVQSTKPTKIRATYIGYHLVANQSKMVAETMVRFWQGQVTGSSHPGAMYCQVVSSVWPSQRETLLCHIS